MENKKQIIHVHGGEAFNSREEFYEYLKAKPFELGAEKPKKWRDYLKEELIDTHEYHLIQMLNAVDADYKAWEIWFDKVIPYLKDDVVLVGHSLGGSFYLRYLATHQLPVRVTQLHLVAPGLDAVDCPGMGNFCTDLTDWKGILNKEVEVHIWHSEDDELVPINHSERLSAAWPEATLHTFTDRGHFLQPEFPELAKVIKES